LVRDFFLSPLPAARGLVKVNGKVQQVLGSNVFPEDVVQLNGEPVPWNPIVVTALNKPMGVVVTHSDKVGLGLECKILKKKRVGR
jgi:16S rRNA U516 pseudouridylate synthase RsuA-like enzyme